MSYRVIVTREDGHWLADVPELEGTHTHARTLSALDRYVREAVVLGADLPDDAMADLEFDYHFNTGDRVVDAAADIRRQRADLERAERQVAESTERTVTDLVARGYSVRDVAVLTGLSYQRVSQLTSAAS